MPSVLSEERETKQSSAQNDSLSIREVSELFNVTRHRVVVACALMGVVPRKVAQTYAIRREDLELLRPQLDQRADAPVPAA